MRGIWIHTPFICETVSSLHSLMPACALSRSSKISVDDWPRRSLLRDSLFLLFTNGIVFTLVFFKLLLDSVESGSSSDFAWCFWKACSGNCRPAFGLRFDVVSAVGGADKCCGWSATKSPVWLRRKFMRGGISSDTVENKLVFVKNLHFNLTIVKRSGQFRWLQQCR